MSNKAFTLIELLAVIVILAIIALIAVPIVVNIIDDSKKSSNEESIKMYGKAIENAAGNYFLKHPEKKNVTVQNLKDKNLINYDGTQVECAVEKIYKSGKIYLKDCTVGGTKVDYTYGEESYKDYIHLVEDTGETGLTIGDKYIYDVNDNDTFTFYVLSIEENNVNLIMDRNICNDGTANYTSANNYCRYSWHKDENNNNYGPDTAMAELYNGTKYWNNVPAININYEDKNIQNNDNGYIGITTDINTKVTRIIGKPSSNVIYLGTKDFPMKARLPNPKEINKVGCTGFGKSCPQWIVENLKYWCNDYLINAEHKSGTAIYNIEGYWLISSQSATTTRGESIYYFGHVSPRDTNSLIFGVRPVIAVPISNF